MVIPGWQSSSFTFSSDIISGDFNTDLSEPQILWLLSFLSFSAQWLFSPQCHSHPLHAYPPDLLITRHCTSSTNLNSNTTFLDYIQPVNPSSFCHRALFASLLQTNPLDHSFLTIHWLSPSFLFPRVIIGSSFSFLCPMKHQVLPALSLNYI